MSIPAFGAAEVLRPAELPTPEPGPGQVAIDVAFAGVNYAEVVFRRGCKIEAAERFGYDDVIVREELAAYADGLSGGAGFDVIVDPVGASELWLSGKALMGFNLAAFSALHPGRVGRALRRPLDAVGGGDLMVEISAEMPLEEAAEAHRRIEAGNSVGKFVLAVDRR